MHLRNTFTKCLRAGLTILLVGALSLICALPDRHSYSARNVFDVQPRTGGSREGLVKSFGELPLSFELNQGQLNHEVRFLSRGAGNDIYLTSKETILILRKPIALSKEAVGARHAYESGKKGLLDHQVQRSDTMTYDVVKMKLVGANDAIAYGRDELPGTVNYFIGKDPKKWRTNVRTFSKVAYENVYPGIDQIFYGTQRQLEYDFVVAPGANPNVIRLAFKGVKRLHIDQGDLVLQIKGSEEIRFKKPFVYQEVNNVKQEIVARYVIRANHQVSFETGDYDASKPLIIDPVLSYSTYLGGSGNDAGFDVAVDGAGSAYVTGSTDSPEFSSLGGSNAFVAKLNSAGTERTYLAIIGGSGDDTGFNIVVDGGGSAYVTGSTDSVDFPSTNSIQSNFGGGSQDAFIAKLNPSGSAVAYATYFGGSGNDSGFAIAIDTAGSAYITGSTDSTEFSTLGSTDAFVAKLNPAGNERTYLAILGGTDDDTGFDIAVDGTGSAYVVGSTDSDNFTTANALQPNFGGTQDAFLAKLNPTGSTLLYSTYLGGSGNDSGFGIAVDSGGNSYVTGSTDSTEYSSLGGRDVFVAKFSTAGDQRTYFTILGGSGDDAGFAIAVDGSGGAYVTGSTDSTNFTTANALQPSSGGSQDIFVAKLTPSGSTLDYSTFLGNSGNESGFAVAVDSAGNTYATGFTSSNNFPTASPSQSISGGNGDAFILKISGSGSPATLQFTFANYSVAEGEINTFITVSRTGDAAQSASVNYSTSNGSATGGASCASSVDYASTSGTLSFNAGEVSKTITLQTCDDNIYEGNETVNLTLSSPTGGPLLGVPTNAVVTIVDNETPPAPTTGFWVNMVGVTPAERSLTKTAPDGWGNAGARSSATIPVGDGYVEFTATETNKDRMAGLGTGDSSQHYSDIEYAVDLTPGGVAWVFESGVGRGVYTLYQAGDVFRVGVEGGVVKYRKNGTLFYTSSGVPVYPLLLDTSLYSTGATITNAAVVRVIVETFGPPTVTTTAATSITSTSATLNGNVNPNALATTAWFEWGTDPTLTSNTQTSAQGIGSGTSSQAISANLSGLTASITYYFRAVGSNSAGTTKGSPIQSFTTGPGGVEPFWANLVGVSATGSGNSLTKTAPDGWGNGGARSIATINSGDGYVEFTATEMNKDRMAGLGTGDSSQHYSDIEYAVDLTPGGVAWVFESGVGRGVYTLYQAGDVFRIGVEGGVVKYRKNGTLFYTSSVAPVYPLLLDTSLYSTGATITNALISGGGGPSPTPPTVTTTAATSITSTSATLNGSANPNGLATNAWFEWGTDPTLASNTATSAQGLGSGTSSQALSANLSGLTSNTTYYFRAVGSNSAGPSRGSILSFIFSTAGGPTTESVVWTETLGVLVSGNNLTKTAGDGWGNAGASSSKGIVSGDGYIEFTATETNKDRMAGLSNGDTNKEFADIDFAMNLTPGGIAWVFESGVSRGVYTNYQGGDVFRIAVEGGVVKYRRNGTLFYTSSVVPAYPLLLDTSLNSNGATVNGAMISGSLQSLVPTLESVVWTNVIGSSTLGNNLTKIAADGWGNAGAVSTRSIPFGDGYVQFTATETNRDRMAGLSKGDLNQHYADIDYAVNLTPGGTAWVFESGVSRGVYTLYQAGDVFRIAVEGGVVKYSKNGSVFYTSTVAPAYPLLLDTALSSTGATITNAVIFGKF